MRAAVVAAMLSCASRGEAGSCSISSISGIAFGSYDTVAGNVVDMSGTLGVTCTLAAGYTIDLGPGNSGTALQRSMARTGGGTAMLYNLYVDLLHSQIWGDNTNGTSHYAGVGTGVSATITIYGEIKAHQDLSVGSYTDNTISVTVNF
jgi:spore coat protein U-like protein